MKRIYYNKLVRDKIPRIIKESGGAFKFKMLDAKEFKRELLKKVGEEASALPGLFRKAEIAGELGDTLDVIGEVQRAFRISDSRIEKARQAAYLKKGGFKKRLYLVWSEDTGYKTNERRYRR